MNKYAPAIPEGYRLLHVGETIRDGDIYWSTKWYSVSETMAKVPMSEGMCYARKDGLPGAEDVSLQDRIQDARDAETH